MLNNYNFQAALAAAFSFSPPAWWFA